MSNYSSLKSAVTSVVKQNGANAITGALLQSVLISMINSLGAQFQFKGIATTGMNPGTPDYNVAYLAGPGTYTNFGGKIIEDGSIGILKYNGTWAVETLNIGSGGGGYQPNNEDIDLNANNQLQFANRSSATGQLGHVILRSGVSISSQMSAPNTIYEIRYNFDLEGNEVEIPENCVLHFVGGSLTNGSILFNKTTLSGAVRLYTDFSANNNFSTGGYIANREIYASWFGVVGDGSTDSTEAVQRAFDHLNNNMITLYIDANNIVLKKTITTPAMINARPYKVIGGTKNDRVFTVDSTDFTGTCVFDINQNLGSCIWEDIAIRILNGKTIDGFHFNRIRNSIFRALSVSGANIGARIDGISYASFVECRFDYNETGVQFNGTFNSIQFRWLHVGANTTYGIYAPAGTSATNILISGLIAEQNREHVHLEAGVFRFDDPYLADQSLTPFVNKGADVIIRGVGNESGISSAGTGEYRPSDSLTELKAIEVDGGITRLQDVIITDNAAPVGSLFLKNSYGIRHKSGTLHISNAMIRAIQEQNAYLYSDAPEFLKINDCAENFVLDGSGFGMGVNYNLYKSHSNKFSISVEPTISYVPNVKTGRNILRVTIPICESKKPGIVFPLRFPSWMVGRYCIVRLTYQFGETETHSEMAANGHSVITDSAVHLKSWVTGDQANAELTSRGLQRKYMSSPSWYGYTYAIINNSENGAVNGVCTLSGQVTTNEFPMKVRSTDDFLVLLFATNTAMTLTEDFIIDFHEVVAYDMDFQGRYVKYKDTDEKFSFTTAQRPTFANPSNAIGLTIYDSTLKKCIRFDGTNWIDSTGATV